MPQLPTISVVTPILSVLSAPRLANRLQSECEWQSMNPGATTRPAASITRLAAADARSPMAARRSPSTPRSARTHGAPLPSTTQPPRITTSSIVALLASGQVVLEELDDLAGGALAEGDTRRHGVRAAGDVDVLGLQCDLGTGGAGAGDGGVAVGRAQREVQDRTLGLGLG